MSQDRSWFTLIPPKKEEKRLKKLIRKGKVNEENLSKMFENSVEVKGQNTNDDRQQSLNEWYNLFTKK
jgi:hypothetical protein